MSENDALIGLKTVGEIRGNFFVPSYQRGYRWGEKEINALLDDIYEFQKGNNSQERQNEKYCLQPVVVNHKNDKGSDEYELIDGQQRITTIYLICSYIDSIDEEGITIKYETRNGSAEFLKNCSKGRSEERKDNPDFFYMASAYDIIEGWFEKKKGTDKNCQEIIKQAFDESVQVIWYQVEEKDSAFCNRLFQNLNIGRIPLTDAELVKALLLCNVKENETKSKEIALQWDHVEKELHNDGFWYFLVNTEKDKGYQTRIDLILNLVKESSSDKSSSDKSLFDYCKRKIDGAENKGNCVSGLWKEFYNAFLRLKGWYDNNEFYHKIGYLIETESKKLEDIYTELRNKTDNDQNDELDERIKESLKLDKDERYLDWNYQENYKQLYNLLLLFNVVTTMSQKEQRFPFDKFKRVGKKSGWSIEHVFAQNPKNLNTVDAWDEWIRNHKNSIVRLKKNATEKKDISKLSDLIVRMEGFLSKTKDKGETFDKLSEEVTREIQKDYDNLSFFSVHTVANLALLPKDINSVLNNSTFDVKRDKLIEKDKNGDFIPICTKMVFLKYYVASDDAQVYYWGENDRVGYVKSINETLEVYLEKPIDCPQDEIG